MKKAKKIKEGAHSEHGEDIIKMILEDHKPLKRLIKIMKDVDFPLKERAQAYEEFVPLLIAHAKSEEEVLYVVLKDDKELRTEGFEGEVEHTLADQMVEEAKRTDDKDQLSAKIKVLAELVEHHIEEEESTVLPDFKKRSEKEQRLEMGELYISTKEKYDSGEEVDSPSEKRSAKKHSHVSTTYN